MTLTREYNRTALIFPNESAILTIYIALKPLYLNQSGFLQISDFFLVFGLIYVCISARGIISIPSCAKSLVKLVIAFVLFVCMVNGLWSFTEYNYIRPTLYYIFNFFAVMLCLYIYQKVGATILLQATLNGVFLSAIVALIGLLVDNESGRTVGFFNNPNQLGFYGLIIIAFVLLCRRKSLGIKEILVLAVGGWCIVASMSKAAFVAVVLQCVISAFFMRNGKSVNAAIKRVVLILGAGTFLYIFLFTDMLSGEIFAPLIRMKNRLLTMVNESDSSLGSGRGYDRIKEMGVHILWGMGEGNYDRFVSLRGLEAHSTYATVMVSYGAIGFLLYGSFLMKIICSKRMLSRNLSIISGILLYSVSHNGIRNTLVWILLAIMYVYGFKADEQTNMPLMQYETENRIRVNKV